MSTLCEMLRVACWRNGILPICLNLKDFNQKSEVTMRACTLASSAQPVLITVLMFVMIY
jgi:hypothetical protein